MSAVVDSVMGSGQRYNSIALLKTKNFLCFEHYGRHERITSSGSNGQDKQLPFRQHLANVNGLLCKIADS